MSCRQEYISDSEGDMERYGKKNSDNGLPNKSWNYY